MVKVIVKNLHSNIDGFLPEKVTNQLYDTLSYTIEGYHFAEAYQAGHWDGRKRLYHKSGQNFLTGLVSYVREILDANGIQYTMQDTRVMPAPSIDLSLVDVAGPDQPNELWKHQILAVKTAVKKTRGVFQVSTGGGKTSIVAAIIAALGVRPFCFFVLSKDLMIQARDSLEATLLDNNYGRKIEVGIIGDGKCEIKDINVVMVQSAVQALDGEYVPLDDEDRPIKATEVSDMADHKELIVELLNNCQGWYFDECQHLSAPTAQLVSQNTPNAYYRYGGSATPYRDDGAEILIEAVTGRKFVSIPASYLIRSKILMKPKIHVIPINSYQEDQAQAKDKGALTSANYNSIYKKYIVENEYRNLMIVRLTQEFNSQNLSTLILVKQIKHGEILQDLIPGAEFIQGNTSSDIRKAVIDGLRDKSILCVIATSLADEGLDIKTLNTIIVAGSGKSSTRAFQRVGRVLRTFPGKEDAIVVDFWDNAPYVKNHSKRRVKLYEFEEEFEIIKH